MGQKTYLLSKNSHSTVILVFCYFKIILATIGLTITYIIPVTPIARPAIAPATCPYLKAVPVPTACPVPPRAKPTATGSLIFNIYKTVGPSTLVKIPVATTTTNVTVASPCILSVIPTAIAVVTDLGKSEIAKKKSIPKALATKAVKLVFTTTATKVPIKMLLAWCFMR